TSTSPFAKKLHTKFMSFNIQSIVSLFFRVTNIQSAEREPRPRKTSLNIIVLLSEKNFNRASTLFLSISFKNILRLSLSSTPLIGGISPVYNFKVSHIAFGIFQKFLYLSTGLLSTWLYPAPTFAFFKDRFSIW